MKLFLILNLAFLISFWSRLDNVKDKKVDAGIIPGAEGTYDYIQDLKGKRVAMAVNHTSLIGERHLVDSLLDRGVDIVRIFAPEHGFRGHSDAGEQVHDAIDERTGIPLISLHGAKKKPSRKDMEDIDVLVFDIQDVGVRFYTYISTLHYVMEAAAENNKAMIVLDRPNPNIHYVDGPVLKDQFTSFVGMHNIPVVYGMTIGEFAIMLNEESWLKDGVRADLKVVEIKNYSRSMPYTPPVKPSPNLPNLNSILHYPSLCFFEASYLSIGRGTDFPFEVIGHPQFEGDFSFTPVSRSGAKNPKHKNVRCFGTDLRDVEASRKGLDLSWLIEYYALCKSKDIEFFLNPRFFNLLAGTDELMKSLERGDSEDMIRSQWKTDLEKFKKIRSKYLIYPD